MGKPPNNFVKLYFQFYTNHKNKQLHLDMPFGRDAMSHFQHNQPNKEKSRRFFRPDQRPVHDIPEKNLYNNYKNHCEQESPPKPLLNAKKAVIEFFYLIHSDLLKTISDKGCLKEICRHPYQVYSFGVAIALSYKPSFQFDENSSITLFAFALNASTSG